MYIEHIKYYSDHSRWIAKLFLQFCREYKYQFLMFESNTMSRRERFNWLVRHPLSISGAVIYFESASDLIDDFTYRERCTPTFYRLFMWRYFLLTHQKHIPPYFRSYIGEKQLVSVLKRDGTRNDKRLENIFKILSICNE
jgi:hypothetical protein